MASSSPSPHRKTHSHCFDLEEEKLGLEEGDQWLELGLGMSNYSSSRKEAAAAAAAAPVSGSSSSDDEKLGLVKLGLEIGHHHYNGMSNKSSVSWAPPTSNNNHSNSTSWWKDYDLLCNDSIKDSTNSFVRNNWQMPVVPKESHHNYRPHHHFSSSCSSGAAAGLWFTLRSSTNRQGEALPQVPKAFIRVKDENVTVFMVKKYLVTKLGLSNEAEIDIRCMGQNLLHSQTLKQVRDSVWLPGLVESVNSPAMASVENSCNTSVNHLMPLQYARRCIFK